MTCNSPKTYTSAVAFRRALEDRLRKIAQTEKIDINRLRRQLAFDRLLARLFQTDSPPWMLKGGYALELRMKSARSTIDIDLTMQSLASAEEHMDDRVRAMLQEHAATQLGDWLEFLIGAPMKDLDAAPYGGARFPVEARMDARVFAKFHLDVGIGDVVIFPLDELKGRDWLGFAGIKELHVKSICPEQHFAEKFHAYTLPRSTPNSRVKDLVDMVLLVEGNALNPTKTAEALRLTFERRNTHTVPTKLEAPPEEWARPFAAMAETCGLTVNIEEAFEILKAFSHTLPL